ncbi:MAG: biopolymer transporter ExbD [Pseudomonadales bacterium]|nr:biopolymer transporter ExbD [Pseudomonadales bacterium]
MRRLRKHKRHVEDSDLDVTPFMNLMIVLVPVLLLSMVFTHTTIIELDFPSGESAGPVDPKVVHLEVVVNENSFRVADGRGGKIKELPKIDNEYDYQGLSLVMQELKRRTPEKRDITILLGNDTDYQTLVSVMDKVRSYRTYQALDVVNAELFPVISLGDSPRSAKKAPVAS